MRKRWIRIIVTILWGIGLFVIADCNMLKDTNDGIKHFTAWFDTTGTEIDKDNEIKKRIATKIGADCEETWLGDQTRDTAIRHYIASGTYPDFMTGSIELYEANALIPLDMYWEDYPNIKSYMSDKEWDECRQADGHIYWIPQFGVRSTENQELIHEGEAFWIQTRVLKWAGYPIIRTVDEYFNLLSDYLKAHPQREDGEINVGFCVLCDDWRYFCLENVPQFLDGYPNDGCIQVNPNTYQVSDYNVTPTAKKYFALLNKEYHAGVVDPESFTLTYEEYTDKLATGVVLGMVDAWWQFYYNLYEVPNKQQLSEWGCDYVPLPITIDESVPNKWHVKNRSEINTASGVSITVSCTDPQGALKFINDLLDPEIQNLRYWGIKDVDYKVDKNGLFYIAQEQGSRYADVQLVREHFCSYSNFPRKEGLCEDGINAFSPEYQPNVFLANLPASVKECLQAYGCETYVDMLGSNEVPGPWYPMYTQASMLTYSTEAGSAWKNMTEVKQLWLPQVVMSEDFEKTWQQYQKEYQSCNPQAFISYMQDYVNKTVK